MKRCHLAVQSVGMSSVESMKDCHFTGRYESLEHWRGFAAIWVMMHHSFGSMIEHHVVVHWSLRWLLAAANWGWLGVPTFFVISGYCIAANVYRMRDSGRPGWPFLADRCLRIYPVYWAVWLVSILLCIICAPLSHLPAFAGVPMELGEGLANLFLVEPYFGLGRERVLLVAWTLWFELGFYVIVAVGLSLRQWGFRWEILLGFATLAALYGILASSPTAGYGFAKCGGAQPPVMGYFFVLRYWGQFLLGGFVFLALLGRSQNRNWGWLLFLVSSGIGLAGLLRWEGNDRVGILYAVAFAACLYLIFPFDRRLAAARCLKPIAAIGAFSYSLYLIHIPVAGRAVNILTRAIPETSAGYIVVQISSWAAGLLAAWAIYRVCEQPMERFRKHLNLGQRFLRSNRAAAVVVPAA